MIDVQFFLVLLQVCSQRGVCAQIIETELQQFSAGCQRPALQSLEGNTSPQAGILHTEQLTNSVGSIWPQITRQENILKYMVVHVQQPR